MADLELVELPAITPSEHESYQKRFNKAPSHVFTQIDLMTTHVDGGANANFFPERTWF